MSVEPTSAKPGPDAPAAATTWRLTAELELLVSGAVVFTLFQLPGFLQGIYFRIQAWMSPDLFLVPFMAFYLGSLLTLTLIVCFSAHFLLRSFWVALAGLNHAFPEGVRWEEVDQSPILQRITREIFPSNRELEKRLDKIASTVFSILFFLLLQLLFVFLVFFVLLLVTEPLRRLLLPDIAPRTVLLAVLAALLGPLLTASLVDRWMKNDPGRLDRHPRLTALVGRTLRFYLALFVNRLYTPIQLTFASHFSTRATVLASTGGLLLVVALFGVTFLAGSGTFAFDSYVFFPERASGGAAVEPVHYENLATGRSRQQWPRIQSDVITDPYVRLFIPFRVERDDARLRELCPDLAPRRGEGLYLRRRAADQGAPAGDEVKTLDCMWRIYEVTLNGSRLASADVAFYRHPETGERGLVAYLPTADLPRGRNLISVRYPPRPPRDGKPLPAEERRRDDARRQSFIPFWR